MLSSKPKCPHCKGTKFEFSDPFEHLLEAKGLYSLIICSGCYAPVSSVEHVNGSVARAQDRAISSLKVEVQNLQAILHMVNSKLDQIERKIK